MYTLNDAERILILKMKYHPNSRWKDYIYSLSDPTDFKSGDFDLLTGKLYELYSRAYTLVDECYSCQQSRLVWKEDLEEIKAETSIALKKFNDALDQAFTFYKSNLRTSRKINRKKTHRILRKKAKFNQVLKTDIDEFQIRVSIMKIVY